MRHENVSKRFYLRRSRISQRSRLIALHRELTSAVDRRIRRIRVIEKNEVGYIIQIVILKRYDFNHALRQTQRLEALEGLNRSFFLLFYNPVPLDDIVDLTDESIYTVLALHFAEHRSIKLKNEIEANFFTRQRVLSNLAHFDVEVIYKKVSAGIQKFQLRKSDWMMVGTTEVVLNTVKYNHSGQDRGYHHLINKPLSLGCINVKHNGEQLFKGDVLSAFYPTAKNPDRLRHFKPHETRCNYWHRFSDVDESFQIK
ncbi:hypothetical protein CHS0354_031494 [Potamilus streckersoni]|uniref:Uncharacterized protein n=1 Tax=Potamilus streckersoni TaxID=2493646 RepID=A0AAE0SHC7_9BIVA|nr:hypothetical protein CHS0354_031494 [Potamilus streckersoni]